MIRIISGPIGSGKTYAAVAEMLSRSVREPYRGFATNIAVTDRMREHLGPRLRELDYEEAYRWWRVVPTGFVTYLDEGQTRFDAQSWSTLVRENPDLAKYLAHIRHYRDDRGQGDEVHVISQRVGHLAKRFRDLAGLYTWCQSMRLVARQLGLSLGLFPELFWYRDYADDALEVQVGSRWAVLRPGVFEYYDSYAVNTAAGVERLAGQVEFGADGAVGVAEGGTGWRGWVAGAMALTAAAAAGYWL